MAKLPVVIWTIVSPRFEKAYAKVEAKLQALYPDIPRMVYREDWLHERVDNDPTFVFDFVGTELSTAYPYITHMLGKQYERVIHIDADVFIFGPCDELFGDFDCACLEDMNIGVFVSCSEKFNEEWLAITLRDRAKYIDGDQACFGMTLRSPAHKFKALGEKEIYSCIPSYHAGDIKMLEGHPTYEGKRLAMLHIAGRWGTKIKELDVHDGDPYFPIQADVLEYFLREFP